MNEKPVVLIVDENSLSRRIMSNFVQRMNVDVLELDSSSGVVEQVKSHQINMVLLDVYQPKTFDYKVVKDVRSIKGDKGDTPIIAVSSTFDEEAKKHVLKNEMNDIIGKPLQKTDLEKLFAEFFKSDNADVFNVKEFEYFYKDAGLRIDILNTFLEEAESDVVKIGVAFKTKDCDNIYKVAHYLKGTFNYLKATKSLDVSMEILRLCKDGHLKDALKLEWQLTENYKDLVSQVKNYIKQL